ncbi:hypothetical protein CSC94_06985 [Zhengella mangrovi]|uniref:Response regulatory domain-containing protein n=1 Tax=Zhengella mangrovi TaxID=1982044 RepID=A0A2G1QPH2_9HYPH|nr:SpoIIE family protein phosphatase [Zhengella mangrovi]PHP67447.1 hypothetical protein CSC94_06985 [Zhengella mangrovi]
MLIARMEGQGTLETVARMRQVFNCEAFRQTEARQALEELELAFAEIATNAVRHASRKPTEMDVQLHLEGGRFRVEFRDDGSPFSGFERAWTTCGIGPMDPMAEGGRGLWLVRQSTDDLAYDCRHGNLWTFTRSLGAHGRPAILVIEDDDATRGLYIALLSKIAEVSAAGSLAEARAIIADSQFDLIVADYNLGDGDVATLLDTVPDLNTPVIFITADDSGAARETGLRHGIHSVMQKPVRPLELRARASEAIAAHRGHTVRAVRQLTGEVEPMIAALEPLSLTGCRVVARGASASAGGGDTFLDLGRQTLACGSRQRLVLADCAGHGMPARLQSAMLGGLLSGQKREQWRGPDQCLDDLSEAMLSHPAVGKVVATVIVIDVVGRGVLELASGGHPSPLLLASDGAAPFMLEGNLPGLTPECNARPRVLRLKPGERLFVATDGLAPASSATLEGMPDAVATALLRSCAMPLDAAANTIEAAARLAFGSRPADDWTFALFEAD